MAQRAGHARLAQEALRERRVRGVEGAQLLERDEAVEVGLACEVHQGHAAATELSKDLVTADGLHDVRHQAWCLLFLGPSPAGPSAAGVLWLSNVDPGFRGPRSFLAAGLGVVSLQPASTATFPPARTHSQDKAEHAVKLFVLDPHTIYRRGLAACLELLDGVDGIADAESVRDAWETPGLFEADLVLMDLSMAGGRDFIGAAMEATGANVIVCTSDCSQENVLAAMQAGAIGFLRKDTLTMEGLSAAVQAAASGAGVVTPELLGSLVKSAAAEANGGSNGRPHTATLTDREQQVLALIAAGHPTREVAAELCYSERTVKNVLHDVVTKLNARSRSQAVAFAVREGLI
jgi:DNA-binding NarL/FixJ family response regulator